jgi:hypothetical protein
MQCWLWLYLVTNQQLLCLQVLIIGEYWYSRVEDTHYIKVKCRNAYTLLTQACVESKTVEEMCPLCGYLDNWSSGANQVVDVASDIVESTSVGNNSF